MRAWWLALLALGGCSLLPGATEEPPPATLADLRPLAIPEQDAPLPQVSLGELAQIYREVLDANPDAQTRLQVQHRLADLQLMAGEAELAEGGSGEGQLRAAVAAYETLLRDNPDYPLNDRMLYQLSRALEVSGEPARSLAVLERLSAQHPDSAHRAEAEFRRAERYFAAGDYPRAERTYSDVVDFGTESAYHARALYMQGWSRFKQGRYQPAIASFTSTLDQVLPGDHRMEVLPRGERELAQDCLRVMALSFSYLDGPDSIAAAYREMGERRWLHLPYRALGDLYLSQDRYLDSARSYRAFAQRYPDSERAHQFQMSVIEAYEAGGFGAEVLAEKQRYVQDYSVGSAYWQQGSPPLRDTLRPQLKSFTSELATYYHALAQETGEDAAADVPAEQLYARAGDYYALYIDSFPEDPEVPAVAYLLGEARHASGELELAVQAWEWMAYSNPQHSQAAEAAYAALLSLEEMQRHSDEPADVRRRRIDSGLSFAATFAADERAPAVLGYTATELLQLGEYRRAILAAGDLLSWQPAPAEAITTSALLVLGHSRFELRQYAEAERAYGRALAALPAVDDRRSSTVERLAASIYRQGEAALAAGDFAAAAGQFQRVAESAPQSSIRVNADYDAADAWLRAGDLAAANRQLLEFRRHYPHHELADSIGPLLIENYEQLGNWSAAAGELDRLGEVTGDDTRREAQYLAAEYYLRAGDTALAIDRYRNYAHAWPQPVAPRMEAMNQLALLYAEAGETGKNRFWLRKMMVAHNGAGGEQSARTRFLAASSSSVLAEDAWREFAEIKLSHPLKKSLRGKKSAMQKALAACEQTNAYALQEFSTQATWRMGRIYQTLSADLVDSERPANLDALALEQYELLLEEQAYPFEEKAIDIHESNARRSWQGVYDRWVQASFDALGEMLPARYGKTESGSAGGEVHFPSLALALDNQQRAETERADHWYRLSLDSGSPDPAAHNQYGIFLRTQGRFDEAEQVYLQALQNWETHADTHRNIGILYDLYLGEREKALGHFQRYQDLTTSEDRAVSAWIVDLERQLLVAGRAG